MFEPLRFYCIRESILLSRELLPLFRKGDHLSEKNKIILSKSDQIQSMKINAPRESKFLFLALLLLNTTCPVLANSVDPDQLASEEAS